MIYPITNGVAQIDDADLELVSRYKWHKNDQGYALWRGIKDGKKQTIRMHRLINDTPRDMVTDHINHDRLDNRRSNLRTVTQLVNMQNRLEPSKHYWFSKPRNRWVIEVGDLYVTQCKTEQEAKDIVALVLSGKEYVKPKVERTHCIRGHSLEDAHVYSGVIYCAVCQVEKNRRRYKAHPRKPMLVCPKGHDKTIYGTANRDCRLCAIDRAAKRKLRLKQEVNS